MPGEAMEENRELVAIEYGRAAPPIAASRVLAGALSIPTGSIAFLGTAVGVINWGGYFIGGEWPTGNRPDNAAYSTIMLVMGLASAFVTVWSVRYALRGRNGGRGHV